MVTRLTFFALLLLAAPLKGLAQTHVPKLIDVHFHYDGEPGIIEKLLDKLNAADGLAFLLTTPRGFPQADKFIHDHPDRLIGFGDVKLDDPHVLDEIDRFHAAGFRGLGEITSTLKAYDDPAYWPIYDRAEKYRMILLFHTGIVNRIHPEQPADISFERSRVTRLDLIARHWPKMTIIGAHLGNPDYAEAGEIGRWNPNLYFDVSGSTLLKKKDDYAFFQSIFWWSGVASPHTPANSADAFEKLVFASDVFAGDLQEFDDELARYHAMLDACQVPQNVQAMIFSGTMWRILQAQEGRAQQEPVSFHQQGQTIQVAIGGRPFTTYNFDSNIAKAFLQPLRDATGVIVTRGFPTANTVPAGHEHDGSIEPHQRDMYFGHGSINGYDFWSEEAFAGFYGAAHPSNFGRMVFRKIEQMQGGPSSGTIRAVFDLEGPDHKPFGEEIQEYTFSGTSTSRVIDCVFTFRAGHGPVQFGDTKEGTFALRLAPQLDAPTGAMLSSEGGIGEPQIWGKRANWVDVDGVIDGHPLGVAVFDSPKSFRHPTYWHARGYGLLSANPFGLSFFLRDPHQDGSYTIPAGKSIQFCYRVFIHDGNYQRAHVAEQYTEYAGTQ